MSIPIHVSTRGPISGEVIAYAKEKIGSLTRFAPGPVLRASVVLTAAEDRGVERPILAEASFDVNGIGVRTQAFARGGREAVDLLERRLRRRLDQLEDRDEARRRWLAVAAPHEWRHGDLPTERPAFFPRRAEDREVVRRKTFALQPMTVGEAVFDMDLLDHDFYLFEDLGTGQDVVVYRRKSGEYGVLGAVGADELTGAAVDVKIEPGPAVLTEEAARQRLDNAGESFVFFLDPRGGRAAVLYRRYDGHYGLVTAA